MTETKKKVPNRARLTFIMIYIGYIVCFIDRSAISIALPYIGKDLHLSTASLGVVASAFFFSYALMQIPGGWLTDKFGTYRTVIVAIAMWSLFTIMTGFHDRLCLVAWGVSDHPHSVWDRGRGLSIGFFKRDRYGIPI